MKHKKIRGHKRIWKNIDYWVQQNKTLDMDYFEQSKRDYIKVWVRPYSDLSLLNSVISPPKGKTRQKILAGIFTIYHSWKSQLDTLEKPYYLKVWYFPNDVSKCQVVCATEDFLDFYNTTFFKPEYKKPFPDNRRDLNWEYAHQEHHIGKVEIEEEPEMFYSNQDYIAHKKWINSVIKNPKTRISTYILDDGEIDTYYSLKECDVWIGGS